MSLKREQGLSMGDRTKSARAAPSEAPSTSSSFKTGSCRCTSTDPGATRVRVDILYTADRFPRH